MKQEADKILRDKLNVASADELLQDFDEDVVWKDIQRKSTYKKSLILTPFIQYWRYAAVLLIGLCLGYYFRENKYSEMPLTHLKAEQPMSKNVIALSKPLAEKQIAVLPKKSTEEGWRKPEKLQSKTITNKMLTHQIIEKPLPLLQETEKREPPITAKEKGEIGVVYFDDMPAEEKMFVRAAEKKSRRKLLQLNVPQSNEAYPQELPLRNVLYAINK
jgi:hypothetical protein